MTDQEFDFIDRLGEMFELQGDLQRNTYGDHPGDIHQDAPGDWSTRISFIKDMKHAIDDELAEFMGEVGWKPWASSRHINFEAAQGELVDAFHFFMNLAMAVDMTPEMLYEKYKAKRLKNIKRQEEGYDGVAGKCPKCGRALDDDAVTCKETGFYPAAGYSTYWCSEYNEEVNVKLSTFENGGLSKRGRGA
jgi:hypothetical protein